MGNGTTKGLFLGNPRSEPLLAYFERLGVLICLYPTPPAMREVHHDCLPSQASLLLHIPGWDWRLETAIRVLRLALFGALNRHPGLKPVACHMGEGLLAMTMHCGQESAHAARDRLTGMASEVIKRSGMGRDQQLPHPAALIGAADDVRGRPGDALCKSPTQPKRARDRVLNALLIAPADKTKLAHGNADRLLGLSAGQA